MTKNPKTPAKTGGTTAALVFMALDDPEAAELIREAAPTPADLQKLLVPSGTGGAAFVIDALGGEEFHKELDVAVAWSSGMERAFFAIGIADSEGGPPNCVSSDSITGFGVRDVKAIRAGQAEDIEATEQACAECEFSKYGSDLDGGKAQACAQKVRLILFDQINLLPMVLQVPPASLKPLRKYKLQLLNGRLRMRDVVTRLSLVKVSGTPDFYRLAFNHVRALEDVEVVRLNELAQVLSEAATA